ncbi:hypothetical protein GCM10009780_75950 [Actinomadura alba]
MEWNCSAVKATLDGETDPVDSTIVRALRVPKILSMPCDLQILENS